METKTIDGFDLKKTDEAGTFTGLLSPYGNVDHGNDVVERGAYVRTLKEKGNDRVLLWCHEVRTPIGQVTLTDREDGLWCKGKLLLEIPAAQQAYACMKAGIGVGLSIGYQAKRERNEGGVRRLLEIALWEASIVALPMNEFATLTGVKTLDHNRIETAVKQWREDLLRQLKGTR